MVVNDSTVVVHRGRITNMCHGPNIYEGYCLKKNKPKTPMLDGGGKEMVKILCTFNRRGQTNHRQKHQVCYEKQLAYMKAEQRSKSSINSA